MANDFTNVGAQFRRFTIHAGLSEAGNNVRLIGITNLNILAHALLLLGSTNGTNIPNSIAVFSLSDNIIPYNIVSSISIR